jgi:hypothetical protein
LQDNALEMHPTGLPLTAKPLIDAGLLFDDEGQSIRAPNGVTRSVSIGDLVSLGDSAGQSASEPSAGNVSGSGGGCVVAPAHSGGGASGGVTGAVAGAPEGMGSMAATFGGSSAAAAAAAGGGGGGLRGMVKSASYSALSGLEAGAVTSSLAMGGAPLSPTDPAAAAAAPVPLSSITGRGLQGELASHKMHGMQASGMSGLSGMHSLDAAGLHAHSGMFGQSQQQQQHMGEHMGQMGAGQHQFGAMQQQQQHHGGFGGSGSSMGGMTRVQSQPQLKSYGCSDAGSPNLLPASYGGSSRGGLSGLQGSGPLQQQQQQQQHQQQQYPYHHHQQFMGGGAGPGGPQLEGTFWNTELSHQVGLVTLLQVLVTLLV